MILHEVIMVPENKCSTYFKIVGQFDPDVVTRMLRLQPDKTWKTGDLRRNGTSYDFSLWEYGRCDDYDVIVENQMNRTLLALYEKIDVLNHIRDQFDVSFCLEIVPTVYSGNPEPCLTPPMEVIDFCYATRTEIDIDLYVMDQE